MNYLIEQAWVQALGWTLLHSIWQACVVAASWAVMRKFLSNASSKQRYLLAISALFVLILCAVISFWKVYPASISNPVEAVSLDAINFSSFEGLNLQTLELIKNDSSWNELLNGLTPWLSIIWIIGAAIMGVRFSAGLWHLKSLRNEGMHSLPASWQARAEIIAQQMGIQAKWKLWESDLVSEPLTLGHFKPIILIPAGMLSGLSPNQVEAIIAHEFAHIYRADFLFNLIQSLIEILFFFHPAVWWLSKEIRRERELCCDDLAVATLGDAFTYAEALTRLQSFCHSPKHFLTMQAKGNRGSFTARIHRLFIPVSSRPSIWKSLSAAMLLMIGIMGSGYYAYTQSQEFVQKHTQAIVQTSTDIDIDTPSEEIEATEPISEELVDLQPGIAKKHLATFTITPDLSDKKFNKIKRKLAKYTRNQHPVIKRNAEGKIVDFFFTESKDESLVKMGIRNFSKLKIEIKKGKEGKPVIGMKDPVGNPYYITQEAEELEEIEKPTQEPPVLVYLDGKSQGFYEGGVNEVFPQLIKKGIIQAHEDIGKVSFYAIENGDMYPFFLGEQLPPPPPVSRPEPHHKKFNIYVLNSWEYLAKKFDQEGEEKTRMYFFDGQSVGLKKGNIKHVIMDLCKTKEVDTKSITAHKLNAVEAQTKYNVKAVEVIDIVLKARKNALVDTKEGAFEISGSVQELTNKGSRRIYEKEFNNKQNFYLFDGQPLGYLEGEVFGVIAKEIKARNIEVIGGIVICDADKSDSQAGKVVQILSEEYEATYYKRLKEGRNEVLKMEDVDPKAVVIVDDVVVSPEVLRQINPEILATINVVGEESIESASSIEEHGPKVVIRTKINIAKPKIATKFNYNFDFEEKVDLEPAVALNLEVSPNPSPGTFNINFELEHKLEVKFSVRDLQGKVIHKAQPRTYEPGSQKIIWEANEEANGIYIIQLETGEGIISSKRIVLKK